MITVYLFFFFFKQKTAYEMRISDWSSDVCSSDLAMFVADGSEAAEAAIKLARQYHVERGEPSRHRVIARRQSYHGNTLGALSAGGNVARRALYQHYLLDWRHLDRKSDGSGKSVSARVDVGGRRTLKKKKYKNRPNT